MVRFDELCFTQISFKNKTKKLKLNYNFVGLLCVFKKAYKVL